MANVLKTLAQGFAPTALGALYTVPASNVAIIKKIGLCNISTTDTVKVTIFVFPNGITTGNQYMMVNQLSLDPCETKFINPDDYLTAGYSIHFLSTSASNVAVTISGIEMA